MTTNITPRVDDVVPSAPYRFRYASLQGRVPMTEFSRDVVDAAVAASAAWAILSVPVAIFMGKVIRQRDQS